MIARLRPSGYVHCWETSPSVVGLFRSRCGTRAAHRTLLDSDPPPHTRRCPVCFPEGADE